MTTRVETLKMRTFDSPRGMNDLQIFIRGASGLRILVFDEKGSLVAQGIINGVRSNGDNLSVSLKRDGAERSESRRMRFPVHGGNNQRLWFTELDALRHGGQDSESWCCFTDEGSLTPEECGKEMATRPLLVRARPDW